MPDIFNHSQLATWAQARNLAVRLAAHSLNPGGGVARETNDPETSGIYTQLWLNAGDEPAPYWKDPETGYEYFPLLYRFNNGGLGMNVGLILDKFERYPKSPDYVMHEIYMEAASLPGAGS